MRILIQAEDAPPNIGGIAVHVWELSKALSRLGHSVRLLTTRKDVQKPRNLVDWSVRVERRDGIDVDEVPILYSPRNITTGLQIHLRFTERIRKWLRQDEIDLVAFHYWDFDSRVVAPLAGSCPLIFTNHSSQFLKAVDDLHQHSLLRRRICFANAIIAPSRELWEKTIALGYPESRCHCIPNGVDPHFFTPNSQARAQTRQKLKLDEQTVVGLCARRAVQKNGLLVLARALQKIKISKRLVIFFAGLGPNDCKNGDPDYAHEVRQELNKIDKPIEIHLLGSLSHTELLPYMQCADFSILPSFQEATSLAGLESMACELPLVASNVGGIPEIMKDPYEGLLVPPGNESALADAITKMINEPDFRRNAGKSARQKVLSSFTWDAVAQQTLEVYQQAIKLHKEGL